MKEKTKTIIGLVLGLLALGTLAYAVLEKTCYRDNFPVRRSIFIGLQALEVNSNADVVVCIIN